MRKHKLLSFDSYLLVGSGRSVTSLNMCMYLWSGLWTGCCFWAEFKWSSSIQETKHKTEFILFLVECDISILYIEEYQTFLYLIKYFPLNTAPALHWRVRQDSWQLRNTQQKLLSLLHHPAPWHRSISFMLYCGCSLTQFHITHRTSHYLSTVDIGFSLLTLLPPWLHRGWHCGSTYYLLLISQLTPSHCSASLLHSGNYSKTMLLSGTSLHHPALLRKLLHLPVSLKNITLPRCSRLNTTFLKNEQLT